MYFNMLFFLYAAAGTGGEKLKENKNFTALKPIQVKDLFSQTLHNKTTEMWNINSKVNVFLFFAKLMFTYVGAHAPEVAKQVLQVSH